MALFALPTLAAMFGIKKKYEKDVAAQVREDADIAEVNEAERQRRIAENGGIDPDAPLDEQYAHLTRMDYEDNVKRFYPLEDRANSFVLPGETRDANRKQLSDMSVDAVDNAFDRADSRLETLRSRTGQTATDREKRSESRLSDLARSASKVNAENRAKKSSLDAEENLLIGRV